MFLFLAGGGGGGFGVLLFGGGALLLPAFTAPAFDALTSPDALAVVPFALALLAAEKTDLGCNTGPTSTCWKLLRADPLETG